MNVEVIKRYVDRDNKNLCEVGKVLDYSEARAKELISSGYVKAAQQKKFEKTAEEKKEG